jgi:Transposase DDE domain
MASSIISKSYSNVIYLQPSFSSMQDDFSSLRHLPYVKLALDFPWEMVFTPIEQEYVKARFERYRKKGTQKGLDINQEELFSGPPQNMSGKERSSKGRKGINFYALFKSFLLAPLLYVEVMVSSVRLQVAGNSDFRTVCGFTKVPSLKTFERFDQIMIENGLWERARQLMVQFNIEQGIIEKEEQLAVDTTHVEAEATLNAHRKCDHSVPCDCPKILTDDNVGLMRKSNTVTYIAHKVALVCGVRSELPLSRSVFKGGQHDGTTLKTTLEKVTQDLPEEWLKNVQYVSADGIYQNNENQRLTKEILQAKLLSPINPRKIKDQELNSHGMTKLDRYGIPHCISGHRLKLKGLDATKEQYIWTCPVFDRKYKEEGLSCAESCHIQCCNGAKTGRTIRISKSLAPQIDSEFPQHLQSFKIKYKERTAIERVNAQAKEGLSMRRVHKRGRVAVEAHVDRCILTAHTLAYMSVQETGQLYRGWTKLSA